MLDWVTCQKTTSHVFVSKTNKKFVGNVFCAKDKVKSHVALFFMCVTHQKNDNCMISGSCSNFLGSSPKKGRNVFCHAFHVKFFIQQRPEQWVVMFVHDCAASARDADFCFRHSGLTTRILDTIHFVWQFICVTKKQTNHLLIKTSHRVEKRTLLG